MININTNTQPVQLFLNSKDAVSRNPVRINLRTPIQCPMTQRILISVDEFSFVNTLYNVTTENNTIVFKRETESLPIFITYSVPPGYYNALSFRDALNAVMLNQFVCVLHKETLTYSFVAVAPFSIYTPTTTMRFLGIDYTKEVNIADEPYFTLFLPNRFNFSMSHLLLQIPNLITQNETTENENGAFARIPIQSVYGETDLYKANRVFESYITRSLVDGFSFQLVNEHNENVDVDFQCTLTIKFVKPLVEDDPEQGTHSFFYRNLLKLPKDDEEEEGFGVE